MDDLNFTRLAQDFHAEWTGLFQCETDVEKSTDLGFVAWRILEDEDLILLVTHLLMFNRQKLVRK